MDNYVRFLKVFIATFIVLLNIPITSSYCDIVDDFANRLNSIIIIIPDESGELYIMRMTDFTKNRDKLLTKKESCTIDDIEKGISKAIIREKISALDSFITDDEVKNLCILSEEKVTIEYVYKVYFIYSKYIEKKYAKYINLFLLEPFSSLEEIKKM